MLDLLCARQTGYQAVEARDCVPWRVRKMEKDQRLTEKMP